MTQTSQNTFGFIESSVDAIDPDDWTFARAATREITHCYHDYPARMIPQVAARLIDEIGVDAETMFDPYCGSGTTLVEGVIRGIDVYGTDLNPLARLMSRSKTDRPALKSVDSTIDELEQFIAEEPHGPPIDVIEGITDVAFWFKPEVTRRLSRISEFIEAIERKTVQRFFQVAFSETVRESSNTRNSEFKLYRYEARAIASNRSG